jgi:hypothetical protein
MSNDLLFVVGSLLAIGIVWVGVGAIRFASAVNRTSRSVEAARWEAILEVQKNHARKQ